ncbi:MAG TPA: hypothetical protein VGH42_07545 [Verrucomicrobiae bacterium]|jgi:hypothetical protein
MNDSEIKSTEPSDLAGQVASLQRQVMILLLALIVVSGTLASYLYYQSRIMGKDLAAIEPQAMQMIKAYNQNEPNMEKFVQQLVTYGQTHPEFQAILKKYPISTTNSPAKK